MDKLSRVPDVCLSVVMPCYNEASSLEETLKAWHQTLENRGETFEILVVNDGSTDGTGRLLDKLRKEILSLRVIHQLNVGHELAVRRGYEESRGTFVLQCDSNGRHDPADLDLLWELRETGLVLGKPQPFRESGLHRRHQQLMKTLSRWLFGSLLEVPHSALRLYRRDHLRGPLQELPPTFSQVNLGLTLLIQRESPGAVVEVPTPFRFRNGAPRPPRFRHLVGSALHLLVDLLSLRLRLLSGRKSPLLASPNVESLSVR